MERSERKGSEGKRQSAGKWRFGMDRMYYRMYNVPFNTYIIIIFSKYLTRKNSYLLIRFIVKVYAFVWVFLRAVLGRILLIGQVPMCNLRPERAPHLGKFCLPLCWRCTGIILGYIVGYPLSLWFNKAPIVLLRMFALLLVMPTAYDGLNQYFFGKQSNNLRRVTTGFIAGIGIQIIFAWLK